MSDERLLEVVDLQAGYNGMAVVHDVSFSVREGEILAILGSNGSGKTTTLRAITGTIKPMGGNIRYKGEDITGMPPFKLVSKGIAMVPEGRMLFGGMTVEDNLLMGAYLNQDKKAIQERLKRVYELFPRVEERKKQTASTLSGGEQQRIAIARVMLKNSPIIILDEATAFADPDNESRVQKAFSMLSKEKTVIMIAHRLSTVVGADNIFVLQNGHVVEQGTCRELVEQNGLFSQMWHDYQTSVKWKVAKVG